MKETQSKVERLRELLKQEGEKAETYAAVKPEDIEAAPSSEDEGSFLVDLFKRLASIEKPPCSCSDLKEKVEFLEDRLDHIETTLALLVGKKGEGFFSRLLGRTRHDRISP